MMVPQLPRQSFGWRRAVRTMSVPVVGPKVAKAEISASYGADLGQVHPYRQPIWFVVGCPAGPVDGILL